MRPFLLPVRGQGTRNLTVAYDKIKRVEDWDDLKQFGISQLTREACGLSMRIPCDLTPKRREIIHDFFRVDTRDRSNWNTQEGQTANVILPHSVFLELAAFCLLHADCEVAVIVFGDVCRCPGVLGMDRTAWDEYHAVLNRKQAKYRAFFRKGTASRGLDNRHVFTERVQ